MAPADSAARAGAMPEASGDSSSGTLGNKYSMSAALLSFVVFFCVWLFLEFCKASSVWLRVPAGLLAFTALFAFAFYGFSEYFGYCAGVQIQMIEDTRYLAEDVGSDAALKHLVSYVPKIKERKNIPAAMHSLLVDFENKANDLSKKRNPTMRSTEPLPSVTADAEARSSPASPAPAVRGR